MLFYLVHAYLILLPFKMNPPVWVIVSVLHGYETESRKHTHSVLSYINTKLIWASFYFSRMVISLVCVCVCFLLSVSLPWFSCEPCLKVVLPLEGGLSLDFTKHTQSFSSSCSSLLWLSWCTALVLLWTHVLVVGIGSGLDRGTCSALIPATHQNVSVEDETVLPSGRLCVSVCSCITQSRPHLHKHVFLVSHSSHCRRAESIKLTDKLNLHLSL